MDRLITLLIAMCVAFAGGVAWEHRPPIGMDVRPPLSWVLKIKRIGLPDGLATQLEREKSANGLIKTRLAVCEGSYESLEQAVDAQNTAVAAMARDSDRRQRDLVKGLERAAGTIQSAQRRAAAMDFTPAGATVCEQMLDVDAHVVESRR